MAQKLTEDDVLKLAKLARLQLVDGELEAYISELNAILEYVELLSEVDTADLKPTFQVTGLQNVSRPDSVQSYEALPEDLLSQAPRKKENYIQVKRMI